MSRRGENIYKRKDGRYEGRYVIGKTPSGRTRFGYVYARQYAEARMLLLQKKAERLEADRPAYAYRGTLADWIIPVRYQKTPSEAERFLQSVLRRLSSAHRRRPAGHSFQIPHGSRLR